MARKYEKARLEGLDDLEAKIKRLSLDTQGVILRDATKAGAEIVRDLASQLAPRSMDGAHGNPPGFLADNIEVEVQFTRTQDKAEVWVAPTRQAFYGWFQETGTQYAPAQPFMRPALDSTKDDVIDEIRDRLLERILKIAR